MKTLLIIYCCLAAAAVAGLLAAVLLRSLYLGRRSCRDEELGRKYLRIIINSLMAGDGDVPFFPRLYCCGGRLVLAETLARLSSATYGLDPTSLLQVVTQTGLEEYLLRRARRTRGYRRAWFLFLLSRIPIGGQIGYAVACYTRDKNRSVRFCALLVQLVCDPSVSLRLMAAYPDPFSALELAEIMALLRRGALPVAYEPLVNSPEPNLRRLGLCIVRQFGIEKAEKLLLRIAAADDTPELGRKALYTLCAMRKPLARREVAQRVASMSRFERKSLLRYMALEGYSGRALGGLFSNEETPYFEALVNSYKRSLIWS